MARWMCGISLSDGSIVGVKLGIKSTVQYYIG